MFYTSGAIKIPLQPGPGLVGTNFLILLHNPTVRQVYSFRASLNFFFSSLWGEEVVREGGWVVDSFCSFLRKARLSRCFGWPPWAEKKFLRGFWPSNISIPISRISWNKHLTSLSININSAIKRPIFFHLIPRSQGITMWLWSRSHHSCRWCLRLCGRSPFDCDTDICHVEKRVEMRVSPLFVSDSIEELSRCKSRLFIHNIQWLFIG